MTVRYDITEVDGVEVFHRSAGSPGAPAVLLLHGFPRAGHMYRDLIPELAGRYHVAAANFPGFGQRDTSPPSAHAYTFDHLAQTVERLLEALHVDSYSLYIHDHGAPVGMRLMLAHPERLQALIPTVTISDT